MIRRNFLAALSLLGFGSAIGAPRVAGKTGSLPDDDRAYWVTTLTRIVQPVLQALSEDKLKERMPVETLPGLLEDRKKVTYLEALGRSLVGISPWLELGPDTTAEGKLRERFIQMSVQAIKNAVTPSANDFMNFTEGGQPLVDAAFLSHALLRAPRQLWANLDATTQQHLVNALLATRAIKPYYSNWLLFTAMVEAALLKFTGAYDAVRIDYALKEHEAWYKGDGHYGDGPEFHFDYYNSFVIQPMLLDVVSTLQAITAGTADALEPWLRRSRRYAQVQERLISPEGTFPPAGRSIAYRCGAFQLLAQVALQKQLPEALPAAQVRSALTAVIRRSIDVPGTFDKGGWLQIGFCGHQPEVGERYISTGSLYLCTTAFLPLGLPPSDPFWTSPPAEWTSKRAYTGKSFPIDKAIR